ncbi:TaqI-like C-terminal specificity domain-containing protein [Arcicella aquatica]|uniref:site-specific DNA-methyltransferase (adenine-specific) n=1 Tax=Arcicella aquatica TaxID=217141 RepID=A0ABU5QI27_9BACT|nr:TaqI-like C-terminal specificity domain-containing protein [Arcicella aquatica]MEA5256369.1 TaqI-like C-terminal specificity domain-containing protein [Arcicella aquatica]
MNKQELQTILSSPFDILSWIDILVEVFGVRNLFAKEITVSLPENDLAIHASEIGNFKTIDKKTVGLFVVYLKQNVKIESNKVGVKKILESIYKYNVDAALVVFVDYTQQKWRFSFISDINVLNEDTLEIERKTTEEKKSRKRYTYVLGKNEPTRTATERFWFLNEKPISLNDLYEAFNVDKLNKEFFKGYKDNYERFWLFIKNQPEYYDILKDTEQTDINKQEKPIRDFAKKLLGRIVFLYFLQKKGWMGVAPNHHDWKNGDSEFIKHLFQNASDKSRFYSDYLVELFFNTLNKDRKNDNDVFKPTGTKVPYLNGGLFDNDAPETNHFNFPESCFSELFDFFEKFNFTIDENSPDDAEVGIDPEMLGHIFENLLEENKDKGAFYTPKEIVQFMCQEALTQYLSPHFPSEATIQNFIREKTISEFLKKKDNAHKLDKLLSKVRVCDPAIGSGAFPIGILQEIFEAKRFIFPYLNTNKFDAAEIKLSIIENSIYGIDLDKGAVDIARLRFWLALVVDEESPRPLPNLDYKIMQGNSLFDTFEGVDLSKIGTDNDDDEVVLEQKDQLQLFGGITQSVLIFDAASRSDLTSLIHHYFDPKRSNSSKSEIKKKIDDKINQKIHTSFEREKLDYRVKIEKQEKLWEEQGVTGRINEKSKEMKRYKTWVEQYHKFDERERKVLELQKKPHEKPFFLWRLFFREVFDEGGFDIVIGNPPYFSISKQPQLKELATQYKTYESTGDIYALFYERGQKMLRSGGVLVYITGSSWLRSNYGQSLRKFFREETEPLKLIDLSDCQIFESATVLTTILAYRKQKNTNTLCALRLTRRTQYAVKNLNHYFEKNHITLKSQPDTAWVILERTRYELKQKIEAKGLKLKNWNININRGVLTGFNEAFIIDRTKKNELIEKDIRNQEIIKPLLRGRDVGRYGFEFSDLWMINVHNGIKEKKVSRINVQTDYQSVYEHLTAFKIELIKRSDQGDHWTNLRNCAYLEDFEKPKIIYPNMVKDISFAYDDKGFYTNQKCFIMTGEKLKYLLGVLNSKLFRYAFEENFPELQGNSREINKVVFEEIPIKIPSEIEERNISIIADYLLYLYDSTNERVNPYADNKQVAGFFEDVMNHLICELYFEEEMIEKGVAMKPVLEIKDIDKLEPDKQKDIIGEVFLNIQKPGSPVRKCLAMTNIKLPDTVGKILSNTI